MARPAIVEAEEDWSRLLPAGLHVMRSEATVVYKDDDPDLLAAVEEDIDATWGHRMQFSVRPYGVHCREGWRPPFKILVTATKDVIDEIRVRWG